MFSFLVPVIESSVQVKTCVFLGQGTFAAGLRRDIEGTAAKLGVIVMSSVTKNTDYLVVGSLVSGGRVKEVKAEELSVPVLPEDEWMEMVQGTASTKVILFGSNLSLSVCVYRRWPLSHMLFSFFLSYFIF